MTRSLADFAKLVELFDQHGVSFVSVTQLFNTTSRRSLRPRVPVLSTAKPILRWRGRLQGRSSAEPQSPILDRDLFNAVRAKLAEQQNNHNEARSKTEAILTGLLFDDAGNKMSPSHTRKQGIRYRYYVSLAHLQARRAEAGSVGRVPAVEVEAAVTKAVAEHLNLSAAIGPSDLIRAHVVRVIIKPDQLWIELNSDDLAQCSEKAKPALTF